VPFMAARWGGWYSVATASFSVRLPSTVTTACRVDPTPCGGGEVQCSSTFPGNYFPVFSTSVRAANTSSIGRLIVIQFVIVGIRLLRSYRTISGQCRCREREARNHSQDRRCNAPLHVGPPVEAVSPPHLGGFFTGADLRPASGTSVASASGSSIRAAHSRWGPRSEVSRDAPVVRGPYGHLQVDTTSWVAQWQEADHVR
jgi:hypothetical protein